VHLTFPLLTRRFVANRPEELSGIRRHSQSARAGPALSLWRIADARQRGVDRSGQQDLWRFHQRPPAWRPEVDRPGKRLRLPQRRSECDHGAIGLVSNAPAAGGTTRHHQHNLSRAVDHAPGCPPAVSHTKETFDDGFQTPSRTVCSACNCFHIQISCV
jgi:hypothetical protein